MADYYPLLARAAAGLKTSTPEARQAIYDRARGALLGQLRGIQPPLPEQDIERESDALTAAVKRLEDELTLGVKVRKPVAKPDAVEPRTATSNKPIRDNSEPVGEDDDTGGTAQGERESRGGRSRGRRVEAMHPAAPTPPSARQSKARFWIVGSTLVAVVAIIGVTAYFLRQDPNELVKPKPVVEAAPVQPAPVGKIGTRVTGAAPSTPIPSVPVSTVPIEVPKSGGAPWQPNTPKPTSPPAPKSGSSVPPTSPGPLPTRSSQPTVPLAYRAALLVQAPELPDHVKTYVGTVVWRLDNVKSDQGQALQVAVRADVDIPDAKLRLSMVIQKNTDPALSASHTITLAFTLPPDGAIKGVKSIQMPQMRADGAPGGDDLQGIGIVPITPTYFLVGLQQNDASQQHNFDLIKSRNWIDLQFVLDDGKAAKITFEKGVQGERVMTDAIAAWH